MSYTKQTNALTHQELGRAHTGNQKIGNKRGALAIFNSFPASASGTTVLLKTPAKLNYSRNNATKNYTNVYHICRAWYNGSYTMMATPMKTLENELSSSDPVFYHFLSPKLMT